VVTKLGENVVEPSTVRKLVGYELTDLGEVAAEMVRRLDEGLVERAAGSQPTSENCQEVRPVVG
jgi:hypothetical protein